MAESSRSSTEEAQAADAAEAAQGNAERLLKALRSAAVDPGTRETLTELGDRARGIVEELSRRARKARESASPATAATEAPAPGRSGRAASAEAADPPPALHRRLDELRACVDEVADVLGATVERLETMERQLGDPDAGIERQLADGIERCERVLMGIDHRVLRLGGDSVATQSAAESPASDSQRRTVLVVCASSSRRAALCVALERQGLRSLASTGLGPALRTFAVSRPAAALLVLDGADEDRSTFLQQWKECREDGNLPAAAVLGRADARRAATLGFGVIQQEHGEAAMAATLMALAAAGTGSTDKSGEGGPAVAQAISEQTGTERAQGATTTP